MSTIAEKLTTIATNEQKIYDKGKEDKEFQFWDIIQIGGTRTNYSSAFQYWASEYIRPPYKVTPSGSGAVFNNLCAYAPNLKKVEAEYFDLSKTKPPTAASTASNYNLFINCPALEEVEDIGIQAGGYYSTFRNCASLHTIAVIRCAKEGIYTFTFAGASALVNITVEGVIGTNISFSDSPLLSAESLDSIVSHLYDYSTEAPNTHTLTLHADCWTDELRTRVTALGWKAA